MAVLLPPPGFDGYLGRFQVGQEVPLWLQCFRVGAPGWPDAAPVLRLYRDDQLLGWCMMPGLDGSPGVFGGLYLATEGPGRYVVVLSYVVADDARVESRVFEVVAGGDAFGPALAVHAVGRPDGDQLLVQLGSGELLVGRGPYVDEGVD